MMLPILVVLLLNDIVHGDDVHRPQQPVPSLLVHVTDIAIDAFVMIMMTMMIINYDNEFYNHWCCLITVMLIKVILITVMLITVILLYYL